MTIPFSSPRNLRMRELLPLHGMHADRHRMVGNVESSPRFAPVMLDATRRAEAAVRDLVTEIGDETLYALTTWIARSIAYGSLWRHPAYAATIEKRAKEMSLLKTARMIAAEWRLPWKTIPTREPSAESLVLGRETAVILRHMSKGGIRTSTLLTEQVAATLSGRFSEIVVLEYRGQAAVRRRGNITCAGIPLGTRAVAPALLHATTSFLVAHGATRAAAGTIGRRLPFWLARIAFAKEALDRLVGDYCPQLFIAFGANDPVGTLLALRFRAAPQATVTSLIEPIHSSQFHYPTRTVLVTGGLEGTLLQEAAPEHDVEIVGSHEACDLAHCLARSEAADGEYVLVLGKDPEESWRNREVLRCVLSTTDSAVRYRAKLRSVHLAEIEADPIIAAAFASGRLRPAHDGDLVRHLPGARMIVTACGNALYLALLAGVPTIGYCFNPLIDLGERGIGERIGVVFPAPICRTLDELEAYVRTPPPRRTLDPHLRAALFGDVDRPVVSQIIDAMSKLTAEPWPNTPMARLAG